MTKDFTQDEEKMRDFRYLSKEEFLKSYSYLTEEEYQATVSSRLEYLRGEIQAERISQGEVCELESLKEYIDKDDVELLEWAGVPEFPEADDEI